MELKLREIKKSMDERIVLDEKEIWLETKEREEKLLSQMDEYQFISEDSELKLRIQRSFSQFNMKDFNYTDREAFSRLLYEAILKSFNEVDTRNWLTIFSFMEAYVEAIEGIKLPEYITLLFEVFWKDVFKVLKAGVWKYETSKRKRKITGQIVGNIDELYTRFHNLNIRGNETETQLKSKSITFLKYSYNRMYSKSLRDIIKSDCIYILNLFSCDRKDMFRFGNFEDEVQKMSIQGICMEVFLKRVLHKNTHKHNMCRLPFYNLFMFIYVPQVFIFDIKHHIDTVLYRSSKISDFGDRLYGVSNRKQVGTKFIPFDKKQIGVDVQEITNRLGKQYVGTLLSYIELFRMKEHREYMKKYIIDRYKIHVWKFTEMLDFSEQEILDNAHMFTQLLQDINIPFPAKFWTPSHCISTLESTIDQVKQVMLPKYQKEEKLRTYVPTIWKTFAQWRTLLYFLKEFVSIEVGQVDSLKCLHYFLFNLQCILSRKQFWLGNHNNTYVKDLIGDLNNAVAQSILSWRELIDTIPVPVGQAIQWAAVPKLPYFSSGEFVSPLYESLRPDQIEELFKNIYIPELGTPRININPHNSLPTLFFRLYSELSSDEKKVEIKYPLKIVPYFMMDPWEWKDNHQPGDTFSIPEWEREEKVKITYESMMDYSIKHLYSSHKESQTFRLWKNYSHWLDSLTHILERIMPIYFENYLPKESRYEFRYALWNIRGYLQTSWSIWHTYMRSAILYTKEEVQTFYQYIQFLVLLTDKVEKLDVKKFELESCDQIQVLVDIVNLWFDKEFPELPIYSIHELEKRTMATE